MGLSSSREFCVCRPALERDVKESLTTTTLVRHAPHLFRPGPTRTPPTRSCPSRKHVCPSLVAVSECDTRESKELWFSGSLFLVPPPSFVVTPGPPVMRWRACPSDPKDLYRLRCSLVLCLFLCLSSSDRLRLFLLPSSVRGKVVILFLCYGFRCILVQSLTEMVFTAVL